MQTRTSAGSRATFALSGLLRYREVSRSMELKLYDALVRPIWMWDVDNECSKTIFFRTIEAKDTEKVPCLAIGGENTVEMPQTRTLNEVSEDMERVAAWSWKWRAGIKGEWKN
ncbi:hypothetical protein WA026_018019 [Henosepilachna vigintioctopunctata]|uniref:Uncharacterized protein n=1 Tax=Henosepilachna vigintioctopunctata TaxID=420089 RepID=A0AAW1UDT3_9CUCU